MTVADLKSFGQVLGAWGLVTVMVVWFVYKGYLAWLKKPSVGVNAGFNTDEISKVDAVIVSEVSCKERREAVTAATKSAQEFWTSTSDRLYKKMDALIEGTHKNQLQTLSAIAQNKEDIRDDISDCMDRHLKSSHRKLSSNG